MSAETVFNTTPNTTSDTSIDMSEPLPENPSEGDLSAACCNYQTARDRYDRLFFAQMKGEEVDGKPVTEADLAAAEVDRQRLNGLYGHIEMRVLVGIGAIKGAVEQQHS
ncbi:MAG: hypothetical protein WDZ42_01910 [Candidatus Saccharimonadales bacterium]